MTRLSRILLIISLFVFGSILGCGSSDKLPGFNLEESDETDGGLQSLPLSPPQALQVTTWNLENFSEYGVEDYRFATVVETLKTTKSDLFLFQELLPPKSGYSAGGSAADALETELEGYALIRGDWQEYDTSVGMLYNTERLELESARSLFKDNQYAFPRPPLFAEFRQVGGNPAEVFGVISVHLKSFEEDGSDVDRRKEACTVLNAFIQAQINTQILVGGDFNDSPRDNEESNVFATSFLALNAPYEILTLSLPPEAFTFAGKIEGEFLGRFLDHIIVTSDWLTRFSAENTSVLDIALEDMADWSAENSDHLPVTSSFIP